MIKELTFYFDNFGFAAVRILLLFYVLCSKEALARLKPISLLMFRASSRARQSQSAGANEVIQAPLSTPDP
jgi:hypothetical protein